MQALPRPQSWPSLCGQPTAQLVDGRRALSPLAGLQQEQNGPKPTAHTHSSLGRRQNKWAVLAAPAAAASSPSSSAPVEPWGQGVSRTLWCSCCHSSREKPEELHRTAYTSLTKVLHIDTTYCDATSTCSGGHLADTVCLGDAARRAHNCCGRHRWHQLQIRALEHP